MELFVAPERTKNIGGTPIEVQVCMVQHCEARHAETSILAVIAAIDRLFLQLVDRGRIDYRHNSKNRRQESDLKGTLKRQRMILFVLGYPSTRARKPPFRASQRIRRNERWVARPL